MKEKDVRVLGIVEIVVAVALLAFMYYVHKSMPIDLFPRIYLVPAEADPCPEPRSKPRHSVTLNKSPVSMLFIENEPTLTYWIAGERLLFRQHEIPEHLR